MKNSQKGFIGILVSIIIALALLGGGTYYVTSHNKTGPEPASLTPGNTVVVGVTDKTKTPVTAQVSTFVDSQGNKHSALTVDEDQLNQAVAEKYGGNSAAINKQIKVQLQASFSTFGGYEAAMIQSKDGSYSNICNSAKSSISTDIKNTLDSDEGTLAALGITINSFRTNELVCKASSDKFVVAMPLTLEDGTKTRVCSSVNQGGILGDADFNSYTCIKKY